MVDLSRLLYDGSLHSIQTLNVYTHTHIYICVCVCMHVQYNRVSWVRQYFKIGNTDDYVCCIRVQTEGLRYIEYDVIVSRTRFIYTTFSSSKIKPARGDRTHRNKCVTRYTHTCIFVREREFNMHSSSVRCVRFVHTYKRVECNVLSVVYRSAHKWHTIGVQFTCRVNSSYVRSRFVAKRRPRTFRRVYIFIYICTSLRMKTVRNNINIISI